MRIKIIFLAGIFALVMGCLGHQYDKSSRTDIPFHKRKIPSLETAIIIDSTGPSLDPKYYEVMGRAEAEVSHVTSLISHCKDAIETLRDEAENVGGDALIDVSCTERKFDANATGTIISFKDRKEVLRVLKDIKAILK